EFTVSYLGQAPDVVFTSEDYGAEYARLMGARHVLVDRARTTVPVSGTLIRRAPLEHLDFLEPCVRAYFVRRVVLIGAESTGKTTLAQQLAERFGTHWVPEYGREHWEKKVAGLTMSDPLPSWSHDEFVDIATEQQARENQLARTANRVLICDTNAFATGTRHERYYQTRDARVDAIGARDKVDLYLLTAPDVPFVQDGVRDGELIRDWMHERFRSQLEHGATPLKLISGSYEQRYIVAEKAVQALITTPSSDND
ncbi:MAG: AAA family ATPase, partial [Planctomycetales bacterium]|nr:AAA family ATPase [Planctomycetales bacterium]